MQQRMKQIEALITLIIQIKKTSYHYKSTWSYIFYGLFQFVKYIKCFSFFQSILKTIKNIQKILKSKIT